MTGRGTLFAIAAVLLLAAVSSAAVGPKGPCGPWGPCDNCERIEGKITSIDYDAMSLVVETGDALIDVQADDDTIVKMKRDRTLTFDDLAVDQIIAACGELDGDVLHAVKINIKCGCE